MFIRRLDDSFKRFVLNIKSSHKTLKNRDLKITNYAESKPTKKFMKQTQDFGIKHGFLIPISFVDKN